MAEVSSAKWNFIACKSTEHDFQKTLNTYSNLSAAPLSTAPLNTVQLITTPLNLIPLSNQQQFRLNKSIKLKTILLLRLKKEN